MYAMDIVGRTGLKQTTTQKAHGYLHTDFQIPKADSSNFIATIEQLLVREAQQSAQRFDQQLRSNSNSGSSSDGGSNSGSNNVYTAQGPINDERARAAQGYGAENEKTNDVLFRHDSAASISTTGTSLESRGGGKADTYLDQGDVSWDNMPNLEPILGDSHCSPSMAGPPTTILVRHIPNRFSQARLIDEMQKMGLDGTYDFLYSPEIPRGRPNIRYAYINFKDAATVPIAVPLFQGRLLNPCAGTTAGPKPLSVAIPESQGFMFCLQRFDGRNVYHRELGRKCREMPHLDKHFSV